MSALNAIFKEPVIPFVKVKEEKNIHKITLQHTVDITVNVDGTITPYRERRTAEMINTEDEDIENLLRLCLLFLESFFS